MTILVVVPLLRNERNKLVNYFFLDASATVKRYIPEIGTPEMNYFFANVPLYRMICLFEGGGEVIFVLFVVGTKANLTRRVLIN